MNREDKEWIINTVCDFMIEAKEIHKYNTFHINAYSNPDHYKIPIRFQLGDYPIEHLVLDYNDRIRLEQCEGINDYGDYIRLSCDLQKLKEIGYINYYQNDKVTKKLNNQLNNNENKDNIGE